MWDYSKVHEKVFQFCVTSHIVARIFVHKVYANLYHF